MRLIDIKAFLEREELIRERKQVNRCAKILEFGDDEVTEYAILSHRWTTQEVDYTEIIKLAKKPVEERDEIRQRDGYRKILRSCEQAQKDGCEWLWVDTCCIDKRSSAELSEAINSMYRWYQNAKVCYAYLHDVAGSSFPAAYDIESYRNFSGWPEWFSRGWTLQELIAPSNVQFLNRNWQNIGDKRSLAPTLRNITGIPEHILMDGLHGNRPCVAQIMSWVAHRRTTRVEDRAYSLMGLLDVNMPMLYGEGKKAFHRLQLEIIRASNDQRIFAWDSWKYDPYGSVLADDPSYFRSCGEMELIGHNEFIEFLKEDVPELELDAIEDRLGSFPITNRGIQIWMLLRPKADFPTLFDARLPCRGGPQGQPVTIRLALWESNYYKCTELQYPQLSPLASPQFHQVHLKYQDPPRCNTTFEINDCSLIENGFTCCAVYPKTFTGSTHTLTPTNINPLCVKIYSDNQANRFAVGLGQSFGKEWIHVISDDDPILQDPLEPFFSETLFTPTEHAQHMNKARSVAEHYRQICIIMQTRLHQTTRLLQISSLIWKSPRMCAVKLEVFHDPGFGDVSDEWTTFDVDVGSFLYSSHWH